VLLVYASKHIKIINKIKIFTLNTTLDVNLLLLSIFNKKILMNKIIVIA